METITWNKKQQRWAEVLAKVASGGIMPGIYCGRYAE
jgi:hypothetical protein